MAKKVEETISYKEAMDEINAIMERLNNQELDIDTLSKNVKRATELIAICKNKLVATKKDVEKIFV